MSQREAILERAYGNIPKEIGFVFNIEFIPTWRGFKYYFYKLKRKITGR